MASLFFPQTSSSANGVNTFLGLTDVPSTYSGSEEYFVMVRSDGSGLTFSPNVSLSEMIHVAMVAPGTPANDSITVYVTSTGTTPNKEVAYKIKNEWGEEVILSSILI